MWTMTTSAASGIFFSVALASTQDSSTAAVAIISFLISMLASDIHELKQNIRQGKV